MAKGKKAEEVGSHHTPDFVIDEGGFVLGMKSLCHLTTDYMDFANKGIAVKELTASTWKLINEYPASGTVPEAGYAIKSPFVCGQCVITIGARIA